MGALGEVLYEPSASYPCGVMSTKVMSSAKKAK